MSCYHPKTLYHFVDKDTGELKYIFSNEPGVPRELFSHRLSYDYFCVPCGNCIGCRLDKSRIWADRMLLELDHSKKAVFVTLTYDNFHVHFTESGNLTLDKRDHQLFLKRLRERFNVPLRFYMCGEYGPETFRPHLHYIIFGVSVEDFETSSFKVRQKGVNEFGQFYFESDLLDDVWKNGFTTLSNVSWRTFAYVARYTQKKAFKDSDFLSYDQLAEFSLMSRRPGIGGYYLIDHPDCLNYSSVFVQNPFDIEAGSKEVRLPRYITKNLLDIDPVRFYQQRDDKIQFMNDRLLLQLQRTDLDVISMYERDENLRLKASRKLKRKDV